MPAARHRAAPLSRQYPPIAPQQAKPMGRAPGWGATPGPSVRLMPVSSYGTVTGPAAVFHLNFVPDVPPISPATQNWLVVPGCGAAAK